MPVGERDQALHVLVDHQDRLAGRTQRREAAPDLFAHQRREALGRFVEDQQARLGHQRAADRQHLLLAAGELRCPCSAPLGQAREQLEDALRRPGRRSPSCAVAPRERELRCSSTVRLAKICRPSGTSAMPRRAMRCAGSGDRSLAAEHELAAPRRDAGRRSCAPASSCPCRCGRAARRLRPRAPRGRRRAAPGCRRSRHRRPRRRPAAALSGVGHHSSPR